MRKFVLYILMVILGVLIIDFCFGLIMKSTLASTTKGDWGRRNYIVNSTNEDLLIFGASRAIHHYDTKILSDSLKMSCYNCGDDGMGILVHLPRFKRILQRYRPKVVVYEVGTSYDFMIGDNTAFLKPLRPYSNDVYVKEAIRDIDDTELLKLHSNLYKYNSSFIEMFVQCYSHNPTTAKDYTYAPLMSTMDYELEPTVFERENVDSIKYKYLREFVDLCQSHGIKMFFTASPWYKMNESDVFAPIYEICQDKGVIFLNYNFDKSFNNHNKYFHDALHMNQYGAEKFSSLIAHEIKVNLGLNNLLSSTPNEASAEHTRNSQN